MLAISITLAISEGQKAYIEDIKVQTRVKLYDYKIARAKQEDIELTKAFRVDSLQYDNSIRQFNKTIARSNKNNIEVSFEINGKPYSQKAYEAKLIRDYNAAATKYNSKSGESSKIEDSIARDRILLSEQYSLVAANYGYTSILLIITIIVLLASRKLIEDGFKQWMQLQKMSDELTQLQLEKTRKEVNGDKPKLILPN